MKDEASLQESLRGLADLSLRYVLGEHREEDFTGADLVIKNPAVPASSRFLALAPQVDSDIGIFLRFNRRPLLAVTGSKGKSTTVSALYAIMQSVYPAALLGGNITRSPLSFIDECLEYREAPVILELSSWQLADIPEISLLTPRVAVITNIFPDHQNRYSGMEEYVRDKERIFLAQQSDAATVVNHDDPYGARFAAKSGGTIYRFSAGRLEADFRGAYLRDERGWFRAAGAAERGAPVQEAEEEEILPRRLSLPGSHNRINLLTAALAARIYGVPAEHIRRAVAAFSGIEHRMEHVAELEGVDWYNDSAATIPDATEAALESFHQPVHLIAGGTDKQIDYTPFSRLAFRPATIHLLAGSATERMAAILDEADIDYRGPYKSLEEAVRSARSAATPGEVVLLSPGATSFGMFANEFDRGRQFKRIVLALTGG
jgi:UDP-N-acetylmuramoylalanine--D-glutamate ligase